MKRDRFLFLTDGPPLRETAFGNHGIAANLIDILGDDCALVITHRFRRSIAPAEIRKASGRLIYLYPDTAIIGLKRFASGLAEVLDVVGAWIGRHRVRRLASDLQSSRILALVGGNGWFLLSIWLLTKAARLPFDIYLVDDLEASAILWKRPFLRRIIRSVERKILQRAERVFTISQGYAEHLQKKYDQKAEWLPTPMAIEPFTYQPYVRGSPDVRRIVFVGGASELYIASIVELYTAIRERNALSQDYKIKLLLITIGGAEGVLARIPNTEDLELMSNLPRRELDAFCRKSWATFLPYSFDPRVREMVATSFSWKLSDSYRAGRPILIFGPEYASIPRYFREFKLPLCATSPEQLRTAFDSIETEDSSELIARYAAIWQRFHSPEAIRARIGLSS